MKFELIYNRRPLLADKIEYALKYNGHEVGEGGIPWVFPWVGKFDILDTIDKDKPAVINCTDLTSRLFDDPKYYAEMGWDAEEDHLVHNPPPKWTILTPYVDGPGTFFPAWPLRAWFSPPPIYTGRLDCVYLGGIPGDHKPAHIFGDAQLRGVAPMLKEKCDIVTIYDSAPDLWDDNDKYVSKWVDQYIDRTPPIYDRGEFDEYVQYGLMLYDFSQTVMSPRHYGKIVPSKMSTYMELCLPPLISSEMVFAISDDTNEEIVGMTEEMDKEQYVLAVNMICKVREEQCMERMINEPIRHLRQANPSL